MLKRTYTSDEVRKWLITFAICLSYVVFSTVGMIISFNHPTVARLWVDYSNVPIALSTVLFLYLFAITYEKRRALHLPDNVREVGELYAEGKSFNSIKDELGLSSTGDVKRLLTKYCEMTKTK